MKFPRRNVLRLFTAGLALMAAAASRLPPIPGIPSIVRRRTARAATGPAFSEAWLRDRLAELTEAEGAELELAAQEGVVLPDVKAAAQAAGYSDSLAGIRGIAGQIQLAAETGCYDDILTGLQSVAPSVIKEATPGFFSAYLHGQAIASVVSAVILSRSLPDSDQWDAMRRSTITKASSLESLRKQAISSGMLREARSAQEIVTGLVGARAGQISRALGSGDDSQHDEAAFWCAGVEIGLGAAVGHDVQSLPSYQALRSLGDAVVLAETA